MSNRTLFNTRKQKRANIISQQPIQKVMTPYIEQSKQQKACSTLIQQSQIGNTSKYQSKIQQPDLFLRLTPNITTNDTPIINKQINILSKRNTSTGIYQQITKNQKYLNKISSQKQKQFFNFKQKLIKKLNQEQFISHHPTVQPIFPDREVLCMTQYIIAQPHCDLYSLDNAKRRQRQSKYLRVLKQMKKKQLKNKSQKSLKISNKPSIKQSPRQDDELRIRIKELKIKKDREYKSTQINIRYQQQNKTSRNYNNYKNNKTFIYSYSPSKCSSMINVNYKIDQQLAINNRLAYWKIN